MTQATETIHNQNELDDQVDVPEDTFSIREYVEYNIEMKGQSTLRKSEVFTDDEYALFKYIYDDISHNLTELAAYIRDYKNIIKEDSQRSNFTDIFERQFAQFKFCFRHPQHQDVKYILQNFRETFRVYHVLKCLLRGRKVDVIDKNFTDYKNKNSHIGKSMYKPTLKNNMLDILDNYIKHYTKKIESNKKNKQ